ncbi:MAG: sulfite exporter TauE/SafE family protein [Crocinitomicaceae bacterium]|nr:sulfite exporter TauE/SafE family protein [Crocinitomicaceae bacterium]
MEYQYIIVAITVLIGAGLTFFSGFGLGTLMLPVFSLYFDLPVAIGATAIVHLANNLFKFLMVAKYIHFKTLLLFGIPAFFAAAGGGMLLNKVDSGEIMYTYMLGDHQFDMTLLKIVIGSLMIFFAWFDLDPRFGKLNIAEKYIPFGGALSGFFGGVSGHQGAFRAAFLTKAGLTKEQFVGTSNAVSLIVDIVRLTTYVFFAEALIEGDNKFVAALTDAKMMLIVGIVFAFIGSYFGKKLIQKATITGIQRAVGVLLFLMGTLMIVGIL